MITENVEIELQLIKTFNWIIYTTDFFKGVSCMVSFLILLSFEKSCSLVY